MSKKNIFAKFQDYVNKPKRNVFDLSFGNNLTTKFGQLTPVFCKECIPGDSFKIHSRFALQFMPMKFPVQTPMKAYLHFFYVRNRTLWKDWMDFIGKTKDNLTLPYVTPTDKKKFFRVGGLADYLGVPNVMYGDYGRVNNSSVSFDNLIETDFNLSTGAVISQGLYDVSILVSDYIKSTYATYCSQSMQWQNSTHYPSVSDLNLVGQLRTELFESDNDNYASGISTASSSWAHNSLKVSPLTLFATFENLRSGLRSLSFELKYTATYQGSNVTREEYQQQRFYIAGYDLNGRCTKLISLLPTSCTFETIDGDVNHAIITQTLNVGDTYLEEFSSLSRIDVLAYPLIDYTALTVTEQQPYKGRILQQQPVQVQGVSVADENGYQIVKCDLVYDSEGTGSSAIGDGTLSNTPYDSAIHLNALPFRAYEAIYNSYYRNAQNNPFILDGVPEYNKYITTSEGGADVTQYDLYQRNWEYDFLTSAVQTPQQGDIAPLVGISVTGEATFQDENGNTYYASAQYDSEGNITGWTSHSPDMPQGSLRLLMDMAGTGISINDLRNVNAFQKFLENNIRHGLKYRDQIKSHFGVDVRYDELDMPEFIGGCSTDVNINKLSQTSESGDTPLGSFVGQASAYGESKHDITHYCDEHGFIIGILSVVPIPVYSQLLPKYFLKNEQLDYYFPEFGHLGYQPILQKEVSPLQTFYAGDNLNEVFGYNRAWYDYLDSTDEVHAQFRTTMRDFIMNRTFDSAPELGEDFLLVDPDQLNDVFLAGTDDNDIYAAEADKIIGSMYFNVSKKSPIPLFGIPKLD